MQKRQAPATAEAVPVYERLAQAVLSASNVHERQQANYANNMSILRDVLYRVGNQYRLQQRNLDERLWSRMEDVLMAVHYENIYLIAKSLGLREIAAKSAVTLLKYPAIMPQDKALYQAGVACRDQGNTNMAFMLLNR